VTVDQLQSVMQALASTEGGAPADPETGTIEGDVARQYLTAMIRGSANEQFLAANGEQITDADRQQGLASVNVPDGLPADVERLIADSAGASTAQQRVAAPAAAEIEQRYNTAPADLGLVCVRQIVVATEAEAQAIVDELDAGAAFEDLVSRSIDESTKANGGALQDTSGAPCLTIPQAGGSLDSAVLTALADAAPGETVGPVQGPGGWYVLQQRPFEEVADSVNGLVNQFAGQLLFVGYITGLDVSVDPRYGRWDPFSASVVAL
jgi:parvulin-like peptidyl-prolyl isomerase